MNDVHRYVSKERPFDESPAHHFGVGSFRGVRRCAHHQCLGGFWGGPPSCSERIDALVERTCEIVRDIAGDAAAGVDTVSESRDRLRHLLDGYGVNAPADIQTPIRNTVAAMTDVSFGAGLGRLESACSARGF
jgi:hypothetical protein